MTHEAVVRSRGGRLPDYGEPVVDWHLDLEAVARVSDVAVAKSLPRRTRWLWSM